MKRTSRLSPFTVIVTAVCLSVIGLALLPRLAFKLTPTTLRPSITVSFSMNGATSKVVETEVTSKLEAAMARIESVRKISSSSNNGSGRITLNLDKHADIDMTRFEVSTLVRQVWHELPQGVSYPRVNVGRPRSQDSGPFMIYTINAEADASEITQEAETIFKTAFADVKGVADVSIRGAQPREWRIFYDADKAHALGLGHNDIVNSVAQRQYSAPMGDIRLELPADSTVRLSNYTISRGDSLQVQLASLASITHRESPPNSFFRINGLNSVYLTISATEEANQVTTQKEVVQIVEKCRQKLPDGYEIHKSHDATEYITSELDKIYYRSGLTTLILLIFVFATTLSVRSVGTVLISLVCDIAIAAIFYYLLDIEMHIYSLASITISLNLMIDNTIVMTDHWRREHNLRAIAPLAAATLTSVASLAMVFFLDEDIRSGLDDFAKVMIINLSVSMCVSLFLVPALVEVMGQDTAEHHKRSRLSRRLLIIYQRMALFVARHRKIAIAVAVLAFGIPTFLLPAKMEGDGSLAKTYNFVFDHEPYQRNVRPWIDAALGGTLRLFVKSIPSNFHWSNEQSEPTLYVNATLPNGSTIQQMDEMIRKMESFLSQFKEISMFETDIRDARHASISISFVKAAQKSAFPYRLKQEVTSRAIELGAGSWSVYGLKDNGFSNELHDTNGSYRIRLWGYNYDELLTWADSVSTSLLSYKRIKEVTCNSQFSYWKDDYTEFVLTPNAQAMAEHNISARQLFDMLNATFNRGTTADAVWANRGYENIIVEPAQAEIYDIWSMRNMPIDLGSHTVKLNELCSIERQTSPKSIEKENQQYRLCIQYEYIGSGKVGDRIQDKTIKHFAAQMPIGYTIEKDSSNYFHWGQGDNNHNWILGLVILIMFFIGAILFDSLRLPLVVIGILPFAFIGLFLTFYLFGIYFDRGGFASMVLLCGITVNSSIYIVCEYQHRLRIGQRAGWHTYLRSFAVKIIPICLTVLSTILGFIPFLLHADDETFWFSMAVGTIGGLVMSLVGVCLFLPVLMGGRRFIVPAPRRGVAPQ